MKIHREGPVPPEKGRRLTKGNREMGASARPETGGEETGQVHDDDLDRHGTSSAIRNDDEQQLLTLLRGLVGRDGPVKAAETLGVTYRTVARAIETNTLTGRMEDALKRRQLEAGGAEAEPVMRRLDALERRQERLETGLLALAREVGARLAKVSGDPGELRDALHAHDLAGLRGGPGERAGGQVGAVREAVGGRTSESTHAVKGAPQAVIGLPSRLVKPWRAHPAVLSLTAEEGEEFLYGEIAPLIVEWRQAFAAALRKGEGRVERARGRVRMCELELVLVREHELTLPPSTYPWDEDRRRDELYRGVLSLAHARWELVQALLWRWARLVLTLGLWRR